MTLVDGWRYQNISYEEISAELEEARRWYSKTLAKPLDDTRLLSVQAKLAEIMEILASPDRFKLFEIVDEVTAYHVWVDALGFIKIAQQFESLGDHLLPRQLLWRSLQGPLSPTDEETSDTDARNIFAQLEFAANVMQKGLRPLAFEDLEFVQGDCHYIAECKRLGSAKDSAVRRNLVNGEDQLQFALETDATGVRRGLLVLYVDRLTGFSTAVPRSVPIVDRGDIRQVSRGVVRQFADRFKDTIMGLDDRIPALVIVIRMLVQDVMVEGWGWAYYPTIVPLVPKDTRDYKRIKKLADALDG